MDRFLVLTDTLDGLFILRAGAVDRIAADGSGGSRLWFADGSAREVAEPVATVRNKLAAAVGQTNIGTL